MSEVNAFQNLYKTNTSLRRTVGLSRGLSIWRGSTVHISPFYNLILLWYSICIVYKDNLLSHIFLSFLQRKKIEKIWRSFFDWYSIMLPVFRMTFTSHMRPGWQKTTGLTKHRKVSRILKILYLKNIDWMEDLLYKHFLQPAEFLSTSSDFCRNFMNCIIFLHFLIVY